jgi:hypothetical protein
LRFPDETAKTASAYRQKKNFTATIKKRRRGRIEFHHFLLESDEQKNPNNPVNPVYYFSLKIESIP